MTWFNEREAYARELVALDVENPSVDLADQRLSADLAPVGIAQQEGSAKNGSVFGSSSIVGGWNSQRRSIGEHCGNAGDRSHA